MYRPGAFNKGGPEAGAAEEAVPSDAALTRVDEADGEHYSRDDFVECYGGVVEWHWAGLSDAAKEQARPIEGFPQRLASFLEDELSGPDFYTFLKGACAGERLQAMMQALQGSPGFDLYKYGILEGLHRRLSAKGATLMKKLTEAVGQEELQRFRQSCVKGFLDSPCEGSAARTAAVGFLGELLRTFHRHADALFDDLVSLLPSKPRAAALSRAKAEFDILRATYSSRDLEHLLRDMEAVSDYVTTPSEDVTDEAAMELYAQVMPAPMASKSRKGIVFSVKEFVSLVFGPQHDHKGHTAPLFTLINIDDFLDATAGLIPEGEKQFSRPALLDFCFNREEGSAALLCSEVVSRLGHAGFDRISAVLGEEGMAEVRAAYDDVKRAKSKNLVSRLTELGGPAKLKDFRANAVMMYARAPTEAMAAAADSFMAAALDSYGANALEEDLITDMCAALGDAVKEAGLKEAWRRAKVSHKEQPAPATPPPNPSAPPPPTADELLRVFLDGLGVADTGSVIVSFQSLCTAVANQDLPEVLNHALAVRVRLHPHYAGLDRQAETEFCTNLNAQLYSACTAEDVPPLAPLAVIAAFDAYDFICQVDPACSRAAATPDPRLLSLARKDFLRHRLAHACEEAGESIPAVKGVSADTLANTGYDRLADFVSKSGQDVVTGMDAVIGRLERTFGSSDLYVSVLREIYTTREETRLTKERRRREQRERDEAVRLQREREERAREEQREKERVAREDAAARLQEKRDAEAREKARLEKEAREKEQRLREEKEARARKEREKEEARRARKADEERAAAAAAAAASRASTPSPTPSPSGQANRKTRQQEAQRNRERQAPQQREATPPPKAQPQRAQQGPGERWPHMPKLFWDPSPCCAFCGATLGRKPCKECPFLAK